MKLKTNDNNKIRKGEIDKNKPTHMKFNYSFLTNNNSFNYVNKSFNENHKLQFLKRIIELSGEEYIIIMNLSKKTGVELIDEKSLVKKVKYNVKFDDVEYRKKESKYSVFRLYTNNNPIASRIIGKMTNNVFYIMYIDLRHEMYKG